MPTSIPTLAAMATPVITALTRNANMTSLLVFKFGSVGSNPNRSMPNGNARPAPFVTLVLTMAYVRTPGRIFGVRRNFGLRWLRKVVRDYVGLSVEAGEGAGVQVRQQMLRTT
jgi:hypothetical protein